MSSPVASHYYMALQGVGDWRFTMGEAGAQLAPYRNYLATAQRSADNRTLALAWRELDAEERHELHQRLFGTEPSSPGPAHARHGAAQGALMSSDTRN